MTIFVDEPIYAYRGQMYCHMVSDSGVDELHAMADAIGMKRAWFQNKPDMPHYDLSPSRRRLALSRGAEFKSGKDIIRDIVWPRRQALREQHEH